MSSPRSSSDESSCEGVKEVWTVKDEDDRRQLPSSSSIIRNELLLVTPFNKFVQNSASSDPKTSETSVVELDSSDSYLSDDVFIVEDQDNDGKTVKSTNLKIGTNNSDDDDVLVLENEENTPLVTKHIKTAMQIIITMFIGAILTHESQGKVEEKIENVLNLKHAKIDSQSKENEVVIVDSEDDDNENMNKAEGAFKGKVEAGATKASKKRRQSSSSKSNKKVV